MNYKLFNCKEINNKDIQMNLTLKAVQLDLARQVESMDFIKRYIDFAARYGFNAVFLYLEWRIRCNTVDLGENNGYTQEELKELIDFAAERNVDLIPGLAALGHSELLLEQEKFAHLAELYPDLKGRFNAHSRNDLCPSNPETKKLLENFFTEVAEIFPSPYFHIGLDEVYDIKYCPLCRARKESPMEIYADHIIFCHDIVANKLKKQVMIWDDMFEFCPQILEKLPRDIIMVNWQYQENATAYQGHFNNLSFEHFYKRYDKLGFRYIFAPAEYSWSNIESITKYSAQAEPFGYFLTVWEKARTLLFRSFPNIAMAGKLWNDLNKNSDTAFKEIAEEVFGISDDAFANALHMSQNSLCRMQQEPSLKVGSLLTHSYFGDDSFLLPALELQKNTLKNYVGKLKDEFAELILSEILDNCDLKILKLRTVKAFFHLMNDQAYENPEDLLKQLHEVRDRQLAKCVVHRGKAHEKNMANLYTDWENAVRNTYEKLQNSAQLKVLFALTDAYGAPKTEIYAKVNGEYQQLASGCFKNANDKLFFRTFFIPSGLQIESLKFEVSGFGNTGICYASIKDGGETLVPAEVVAADGEVLNSKYLLCNDVTVCFLGHDSIADVYDNENEEGKSHFVEIKMQKI